MPITFIKDCLKTYSHLKIKKGGLYGVPGIFNFQIANLNCPEFETIKVKIV